MFDLFQMLVLTLLLVSTSLASPLTDDILLEDEERLLNLDNNLIPDTKEREITYKSAGLPQSPFFRLDLNVIDHL